MAHFSAWLLAVAVGGSSLVEVAAYRDSGALSEGLHELRTPSHGGGGPPEQHRPKVTYASEYAQLEVVPSMHRAAKHRTPGRGPVLTVSVLLAGSSKQLALTLPMGYVLEPGPEDSKCKVFENTVQEPQGSDAEGLKGRHLWPFITSCEVKQHVPEGEESGSSESSAASITMHLEDGIPGLSKEDTTGDEEARSFWIRLRVWYPEKNPEAEKNIFYLHWSSTGEADWAGWSIFQGWSILGDWDCAYSDWEGWGQCSSRCGGGLQRRARRIRWKPPPDGTGRPCTEPLFEDIECNLQACSFPCEFKEVVEGECSALCGGGVKTIRRRWEGDNCPATADVDAVRLQRCNTQPCQPRCVLADRWTVATECSEPCGWGVFWMFRQVLEKDPADDTCRPEWRSQRCQKQPCSGKMSVLRQNANLQPIVGDNFEATISFQNPFTTRKLQLTAPAGYAFTPPRSGEKRCSLEDSSFPDEAIESCKTFEDPGRAREMEIIFAKPGLAAGSRYFFTVDVVNAECGGEHGWYTDVVGSVVRCEVPRDENMWEVRLAQEQEEGSGWEVLAAQGYELHARAAEAAAMLHAASKPAHGNRVLLPGGGARAAARGRRPTYCSQRLPCRESGKICSEDGLCVKEAERHSF
eukprot:TRINITY_DN111639_c0_g1_i1.p1 TRINITY_DN111639_c0_g1~~TRINITY_DN111639_c0_g1_i1.p1  ORF type:complete len:635 (+),score=137.65 TRINITY_DN111639_c0_g1_i1:156-2060(+)